MQHQKPISSFKSFIAKISQGNIHYVRFIIILMAGIFLFQPTFGQKSKKIKKSTEVPEIQFTEKDYRLAEQYFTEGEKYYILEDYSKAMAFFQKALEIDPENAAIHFKISNIYLQNDDLDNALQHATAALNLVKNNKYYFLLLAEIYTKKADFENAAKTYEELMATIPGNDEYLFETAALYIYQENYDEAIDCYNRIETIFGINEQVIYQKQNILLKLGKFDQVVIEGEKLIAAYPGEPDYVINLAGKLIANDRYEQATVLLENSRLEFPDNAVILNQLAQVYRNTGRENEAKELVKTIFENPEFSLQKKMQVLASYMGSSINESEQKYVFELADKIIEYHPDDADAFAIYGDLLQSLDSASAARNMYLSSLSINPNNLRAWQNVLDYELRNNDLDSAVVHAEKALTYFPNQALLYYFGGTAYMIKKENKKAVTLLEQGKRLSSSNLELLSVFNGQLGDVYHALENFNKSDAAYEAALDFDPDNDHVLNNYSYFLSLRNEKLDLAEKMSSKLIKEHPENPTYLDTYAWVLFKVGKYKEAKEHIEKAIANSDNVSGEVLEHYGDILFKLDDIDGAVKQWENAKLMDNTTEFIDKKIADRKLYE